MAGGGYRGIPAAVPTAQNLHSASRGGVHRHSTRGGLPAGLALEMSAVPIGASLLAKNVQTPQAFRLPVSSFTTIASRLAPTEKPT
jgi:hypothetical protein